jgi:hypothetical protein
MKPCKIRRMMMENLVICLVGFLAIFFAKSQMLKWARQENKGGGRSGVEREEKIVKNVGFPVVFPQNSQLFLTLYGLALRWSNFLW